MNRVIIQSSTLQFLKKLEVNNNREWFLANKHLYDRAQENMLEFTEAVLSALNKHDEIATESPKRALHRIYTDTRFHKNRPPYNPRFAGGFARVKPYLRGGYTFSIRPGRSRVACGFFNPNPDDLKRIRMDIASEHATWKKLLKGKKLQSTYGTITGSTVATAPKGFPKDHAAIELLRLKQFIFRRTFSDKEVVSAEFAAMINESYKNIRPFFDHMSEVLTTNLNGELIV